MGPLKHFKLDPVTWMFVLNSAVALAVSWGLKLSHDQVGAITSIATAGFGIFGALQVRPVALPAVKALIAGILVAFAAFGLHWGPEQIGATATALSLGLGLWLRQAVTPLEAIKAGTTADAIHQAAAAAQLQAAA